MTINQQLYGSDAPLPVYTELRAGPLTVGYEEGAFRYFRWGNDEILRMIYVSMRDENWGTLTPIRSNEEVVIGMDYFKVRYDCHYERASTILFTWKVTAEGNTDGSFRMTIDGLAHQSFLRNRAGFCILHPIQGMAGKPCQLLHPDEQWEAAHFPQTISPENPFKQLAGMRWQQGDGVWFRLDMSGDVFETEDQRNWTDASFKTFCTPSALPIPVQLRAGDRVRQQIEFRPEQPLSVSSMPETREVMIRVFEQERTLLPAIGVGASTEIGVLTEPIRKALQLCYFDHYRVEVVPAQADWETEFLAEVANALACRIPVLVALHLSDNHAAELNDFLAVAQQYKGELAEIILFSVNEPVTTDAVLAMAPAVLRKALPQTRIGAGTNYNFTELNRNRLLTDKVDFVSYSAHPQVHAFDNRSMVETLDTQGDTVKTARTFAGPVPIHVSPVTLRQRGNPYAHDPKDRVQTNDQKADPRQPSLWAADWTLGSMKHLAEAGAESITYFQTAGHQGIISANGQLYPAGLLLNEVQAFRGAQVIRTESSQPLVCSTLLLTSDTRRCWLVANHTDQTITVQLPETVQGGFRITLVPAQRMDLDLTDTQPLLIEPFGTWVLAR
jgi:hypothetical protein